jgi:peptidoglycan/LPS O-acetylase OafA/YrhL
MHAQQRHIRSLTGVRAYAAFWVMFLHVQNCHVVKDVFDFGAIADRGYWGVDVFFVLSGLVLSYVYEREFADAVSLKAYARYLSLRLGRIYPLHLLTFAGILAFLLCQLLFGRGKPSLELYSFHDAIMNLALLHAWGFTDRLSWNTVSWSISAEWFAYLLLLVPLLRFGRKAKPFHLIGITALLWLAFVLFYVPITPTRNLDITYNLGILRIAVEFLAGYTTYRIAKEARFTPWLSDALVVGSTAAILTLTRFPGRVILLLPCIMLLLVGLMGNGITSTWLFGSRPLVFLGEVSYSIYMVHPVTLKMANTVVGRLRPPATLLVGSLVLAAEIALVVLVATLAYYVIERPCREWIRRKVSG